jgi:hypothetical protein
LLRNRPAVEAASSGNPAERINKVTAIASNPDITVKAVIDTTGHVRLLGKVRVDAPCRALVTVLEEPAAMSEETALLAEPALAEDWSRPEGNASSSHLQPGSVVVI